MKAALNWYYSFPDTEKSIKIKYGSLNYNAEQGYNIFLVFYKLLTIKV